MLSRLHAAAPIADFASAPERERSLSRQWNQKTVYDFPREFNRTFTAGLIEEDAMRRGYSRTESDRLAVRDGIVRAIPQLRGFAFSLCRNTDRADDLVQETLSRALANIDSFEPGTKLVAWLFTILRNQFRSDFRKRGREVLDRDGLVANSVVSLSEQEGHVGF